MNLSRNKAAAAEAFFLTKSRSPSEVRKARAASMKKLEELARVEPERILAVKLRDVPSDSIELLQHLKRLAQDTLDAKFKDLWNHLRAVAVEDPEAILNPDLGGRSNLHLEDLSLKERKHLEIIAMKASATH